MASKNNSDDRITQSVADARTSSIYDQGLVSQQQLAEFRQVFDCLSLVLGVAGVAASIMNVLVGCRQRRQESRAWFLLSVSLGDAGFLLAETLCNAARSVLPPTDRSYLLLRVYVATACGTVFRRAAVTCNTLAALERFLVLVFPFSMAGVRMGLNGGYVALCVFILSAAAHLSLGLEYVVAPTTTPGVWEIQFSQLVLDNPQVFSVLRNVGRFCFLYVPIAVSLILNILLLVALKAHDSQLTRFMDAESRKTITPSSFKDAPTGGSTGRQGNLYRTSGLVLALTFTFSLLALPRVVNVTIGNFVPTFTMLSANRYLTELIFYLGDLLAYLTQLVLFMISIALSRLFRKTFCGIFIKVANRMIVRHH